MKKYIIILFLFISSTLPAQNILKGKTIDSKTGEPIPGANIYLNNSQVGTSSDLDGNFMLDLGFDGPVDIFISFVGYKTLTHIVKKSHYVSEFSI